MTNLSSINVIWNGRPVGRLALNPRQLCVFEYSPEFISDGVSISPFDLPLRPGVFTARPTPFDGGFGVFDDSLPDGWGQLILDRHLQSQGINPRELNLLDRLALVGSQGRGALEFIPDRSSNSILALADYEFLAREARKILSSEEYQGRGIEEFQLRGGSPGGARPKIFTRFEGKEWLVKFPARHDGDRIGATEYQYSLLAKRCGIEMPETRLIENKYFAVERFDRSGDKKLHVVSAAGLLNADYRLPSIDYMHLFKLCSMLTHDQEDIVRLYRLMTFNYLIGNKDDHAKNFAFIYRDDAWHLAPAFDLLPSEGMNGYHTTSFNDNIRPDKTTLLAIADKVGIGTQKAKIIIQQIEELLG